MVMFTITTARKVRTETFNAVVENLQRQEQEHRDSGASCYAAAAAASGVKREHLRYTADVHMTQAQTYRQAWQAVVEAQAAS